MSIEEKMRHWRLTYSANINQSRIVRRALKSKNKARLGETQRSSAMADRAIRAMSNISSFRIVYDRDSDVLYISKRRGPAARGVEDAHGLVWRYDNDGELIGVTVVDYYDQWMRRRRELTREIAMRFQLPMGRENK